MNFKIHLLHKMRWMKCWSSSVFSPYLPSWGTHGAPASSITTAIYSVYLFLGHYGFTFLSREGCCLSTGNTLETLRTKGTYCLPASFSTNACLDLSSLKSSFPLTGMTFGWRLLVQLSNRILCKESTVASCLISSRSNDTSTGMVCL